VRNSTRSVQEFQVPCCRREICLSEQGQCVVDELVRDRRRRSSSGLEQPDEKNILRLISLSQARGRLVLVTELGIMRAIVKSLALSKEDVEVLAVFARRTAKHRGRETGRTRRRELTMLDPRCSKQTDDAGSKMLSVFSISLGSMRWPS